MVFPRPIRVQTVVVPARNTPIGVRSFLEGLAIAGDGTVIASRSRLEIRVPVAILDDRTEGEQARVQVILEYVTDTGNITIRCPASVQDMVCDRVKILEGLYLKAVNAEPILSAPEGFLTAFNSFRCPAWDRWMLDGGVLNTFFSNKEIYLRELISKASYELDKIRSDSSQLPQEILPASQRDTDTDEMVEEVVTRFMDITGCTRYCAWGHLQASDGNIEEAIRAYTELSGAPPSRGGSGEG